MIVPVVASTHTSHRFSTNTLQNYKNSAPCRATALDPTDRVGRKSRSDDLGRDLTGSASLNDRGPVDSWGFRHCSVVQYRYLEGQKKNRRDTGGNGTGTVLRTEGELWLAPVVAVVGFLIFDPRGEDGIHGRERVAACTAAVDVQPVQAMQAPWRAARGISSRSLQSLPSSRPLELPSSTEPTLVGAFCATVCTAVWYWPPYAPFAATAETTTIYYHVERSHAHRGRPNFSI